MRLLMLASILLADDAWTAIRPAQLVFKVVTVLSDCGGPVQTPITVPTYQYYPGLSLPRL